MNQAEIYNPTSRVLDDLFVYCSISLPFRNEERNLTICFDIWLAHDQETLPTDSGPRPE